ncbi:hypothetical protein ABIA38_000615 [Embleya sp. AB8]
MNRIDLHVFGPSEVSAMADALGRPVCRGVRRAIAPPIRVRGGISSTPRNTRAETGLPTRRLDGERRHHRRCVRVRSRYSRDMVGRSSPGLGTGGGQWRDSFRGLRNDGPTRLAATRTRSQLAQRATGRLSNRLRPVVRTEGQHERATRLRAVGVPANWFPSTGVRRTRLRRDVAATLKGSGGSTFGSVVSAVGRRPRVGPRSGGPWWRRSRSWNWYVRSGGDSFAMAHIHLQRCTERVCGGRTPARRRGYGCPRQQGSSHRHHPYRWARMVRSGGRPEARLTYKREAALPEAASVSEV